MWWTFLGLQFSVTDGTGCLPDPRTSHQIALFFIIDHLVSDTQLQHHKTMKQPVCTGFLSPDNNESPRQVPSHPSSPETHISPGPNSPSLGQCVLNNAGWQRTGPSHRPAAASPLFLLTAPPPVLPALSNAISSRLTLRCSEISSGGLASHVPSHCVRSPRRSSLQCLFTSHQPHSDKQQPAHPGLKRHLRLQR